MPSMSARLLLVALVALTAGCGGSAQREVRLLAPAGVVDDSDAHRFERATGCRIELRVYDPDEDIQAIARRRDTDVIAGRTLPGEKPDVVDELVRASLSGGVVVTVPAELAPALAPTDIEPAGRRRLSWAIRPEGDNDDCARRWLAYATSQ
jgi:hypothetical protein